MRVAALVPGEWPWKAVERAGRMAAWPHEYTSAPDVWAEIDLAAMEAVLNALPPIYFPGGFACSEPGTFTAEGSTYLLVATWRRVQGPGRYFARHSTRKAAPGDIQRLRDHLDAGTVEFIDAEPAR